MNQPITEHEHILDCGAEYVREQQRLQIKMQQEGLLKRIFQIIYSIQNEDIRLTQQLKGDPAKSSLDNYLSLYSRHKDNLISLFEKYQQAIMHSHDEQTLDRLQHRINALDLLLGQSDEQVEMNKLTKEEEMNKLYQDVLAQYHSKIKNNQQSLAQHINDQYSALQTQLQQLKAQVLHQQQEIKEKNTLLESLAESQRRTQQQKRQHQQDQINQLQESLSINQATLDTLSQEVLKQQEHCKLLQQQNDHSVYTIHTTNQLNTQLEYKIMDLLKQQQYYELNQHQNEHNTIQAKRVALLNQQVTLLNHQSQSAAALELNRLSLADGLTNMLHQEEIQQYKEQNQGLNTLVHTLSQQTNSPNQYKEELIHHSIPQSHQSSQSYQQLQETNQQIIHQEKENSHRHNSFIEQISQTKFQSIKLPRSCTQIKNSLQNQLQEMVHKKNESKCQEQKLSLQVSLQKIKREHCNLSTLLSNYKQQCVDSLLAMQQETACWLSKAQDQSEAIQNSLVSLSVSVLDKRNTLQMMNHKVAVYSRQIALLQKLSQEQQRVRAQLRQRQSSGKKNKKSPQQFRYLRVNSTNKRKEAKQR